MAKWKGLTSSERQRVVIYMWDKYGMRFSAKFQAYAAGGGKPGTVSIQSKGRKIGAEFRRAERRLWVDPYGNEVWERSSGRKAAGGSGSRPKGASGDDELPANAPAHIYDAAKTRIEILGIQDDVAGRIESISKLQPGTEKYKSEYGQLIMQLNAMQEDLQQYQESLKSLSPEQKKEAVARFRLTELEKRKVELVRKLGSLKSP